MTDAALSMLTHIDYGAQKHDAGEIKGYAANWVWEGNTNCP